MSDSKDFGAFLIGFIVGCLTGAAVALLFAPQSGEETRELIHEKAIQLRDRTAESVEEARLQAEEAFIQAKQKAEEWTKLTKQHAEELLEKGEQVLEEGRDKLVEAIKPKEKPAEG